MAKTEPVVVVGGSGFLGQHLMKALEKRDYPMTERSLSPDFDIGNMSDLSAIGPFKTMIHLAGKTFVPDSYHNSYEFFKVNVIGTLNCLELCKKYNADMIFASSYVYGKPEYLPVDENHPVKQWNPYASSKIIAEQLAQTYCNHFGLNVCILRIFNLFGSNQADHFLIPTIINGIKKGKLELFSSQPKRDFIYVIDVVRAIVSFLEADFQGCEIFNVGSGKSYSVDQVVSIAKDLFKSDTEVIYRQIPRKDEIDDVIADTAKIKKRIGWIPEYDLVSGLKHAFNL
jgi:UDP-glucose 4-epimerase